jgi:hypothetical protein
MAIYKYFDFHLEKSLIGIDIIDFLFNDCKQYGYQKAMNIYWGNYEDLFTFHLAFGEKTVLLFNFQILQPNVTEKMIYDFLDSFQCDVNIINESI